VCKILLEAGLPPEVIQSVPGDAKEINDIVLNHRDFAGPNFVGSLDVSRSLTARIGQGIGNHTHRKFPRLVGETSDKNFTLIHPFADITSAVKHTICGSFEYQGEKCFATSRLYLPQSRSQEFLDAYLKDVSEITQYNLKTLLPSWVQSSTVAYSIRFDFMSSLQSTNPDHLTTSFSAKRYLSQCSPYTSILTLGGPIS
jgi:acyl-CoA reductase-like NAD-dependent aldehyde dehydrogenase